MEVWSFLGSKSVCLGVRTQNQPPKEEKSGSTKPKIHGPSLVGDSLEKKAEKPGPCFCARKWNLNLFQADLLFEVLGKKQTHRRSGAVVLGGSETFLETAVVSLKRKQTLGDFSAVFSGEIPRQGHFFRTWNLNFLGNSAARTLFSNLDFELFLKSNFFELGF